MAVMDLTLDVIKSFLREAALLKAAEIPIRFATPPLSLWDR